MKFLKIKSADMPTKPKPTEQLPNNLMYVWDPNANDWIILQKDTNKATPPLYDPNNQNVVNQTTNYMSAVKSASVIDDENLDEIIKELSNNAFYIKTKKGAILPVVKKDNKFFISGEEVKNKNTIKYLEEEYNKEVVQDIKKTYNHLLEDLEYELWDAGQLSIPEEKILDILLKKNIIKRTPGIKGEHETANGTAKWIYMLNKKQSSCLSKFLDGPQYSKEIKIEAGLIKDGLVKYAGFDFNRGTKYAITTKGLEVLRKASEAEHNEALNEREKLAYMFGFNTDEVSTLDTTGKVIKQSAKKWTICEADGTELGEVEADSELDAKVKFGIEHPEYAESLSICAKEINAQYEQTTESHEPYPNPSETPHNDIVLENHDGWVNTAEQKVTPEFAKLHSILGEYKKNGHILSITQDGKDLLVSCSPIASYEMKQKIEQLGYECEETNESETGDAYDLPSYTLRIKMK